ncbi:MAG: hypothetical protein KGO02_20325 [Alphaproteobacteria bacterium]|nr:hypothetical protein [Alphaproteobacteria bacterium]
MQLDREIENFVKTLAAGGVEVYNEFSLQHELGIFLRNHLSGCRVQFERNVAYFNLSKLSLEKREIDIVVTPADSAALLSAIELKYPRNGQVPEQMFSFCKDIAFLEQLVSGGFKSAYFLALADDPLFYSGNEHGIYRFFRSGAPITGTITKPTGSRDKTVHIVGSYVARWLPLTRSTRFCLVPVGS